MASKEMNPKFQRTGTSVEVEDELRQSQNNEVIDNITLHHQHAASNEGGDISSSTRLLPSASLPSELIEQQQRVLCEGKGAHCYNPQEKNVFSPPTAKPPTAAPSAQPTSFRSDSGACTSDGQGNFGKIDGPSARTVEYLYQVETTPELNAVLLNLEVLQDVEKAISDRLAQRFFQDSCSPPVIDIFTIPMPNTYQPQAPAVVLSKQAQQQDNKVDGGQRVRFRRLRSEYRQNLVGLSASPEDLVLDGSLGEACPFPTTDGACFVIGGGVTVFGDNEEGSSKGLLWVDEPIHEELQEVMNSGGLETTVQKEHPDVVAIRYIPPGTELPNGITDPNDPNGADGIIGGRRTALSWVLIGLGLIILLGVFLYTMITRRQNRDREERHMAVGAFPIVLSKENVALAQDAYRRQEVRSNSSTISSYPQGRMPRDAMSHGSGGRSNGSTISSPPQRRLPPDLLSYESDDPGFSEGVPLHVFHDEDTSPARMPQGISTSWRDQILHNQTSPFGGGLSLDPNQPIVRPILDDENDIYPSSARRSTASVRSSRSARSQSTQYHSVNSEEDYPSRVRGNVSYYVGSSFSGSPQSSPRSRASPSRLSKLSTAFDQSEII